MIVGGIKMGVCRIQRPTGKDKHGTTFIKITNNDEESEALKYEAQKGDLHLNLICEEQGENYAFYVGSDFKDIINKMNDRIEFLQEKIKDMQIKIDDINETVEKIQEKMLNEY
jgi:hypothetical protein